LNKLTVTAVLFSTALAELHFNENLRLRCESQQSKDGEVYTNVCYPKYKLGEEIVREVKKPPTYGKSVGVYQSTSTLPLTSKIIWHQTE
jgi:hypothetical protein